MVSYSRSRTKERIRKRLVTSEKPKLKIDDRIICQKCGNFSGWENNDLVYVKENRDIKCKTCDKVCIEIRINIPS